MDENLATIRFAVEHNRLKLVHDHTATSGIIGCIQVYFDFKTDDWDGMAKTAVFSRHDMKPIPIVLPPGESCCCVPWEILNFEKECECDGVYSVGVMGFGANGMTIPTNKIDLTVERSCLCEGTEPPPPTPDIYEQILIILNSMNNLSEADVLEILNQYCVDQGFITTEDFKIALDGKEDKANKVNQITSASTDEQYPSAKAVFDAIAGSGGGGGIVSYVQADWNMTDETDPSFIKNKPDAGVGDRTYVHIQSVASDVWDITHALNKYPAVSVVDSGGSMVIGEVDYIDVNHVRISFSAEFSGKCYLN